MKFLTPKRIVLFLLFIFPLMCFLMLSTGKNNFTKLPVVTTNISINFFTEISLQNKVTIVNILGDSILENKSGILNLKEKVYQKFKDYNQFQLLTIYPIGYESKIHQLKKELTGFIEDSNWKFVALSKQKMNLFYNSFSLDISLDKIASKLVFIVDKNENLRGRLQLKTNKHLGYNINSIAELKDDLNDDIKVLYYEYYAAIKDKRKNKADRKEVGL